MTLNLFTVSLLTLIVVLLLMLAAALYRYTERNKLQMTLIRIIILWALMFIGLEIRLICSSNDLYDPVSGIINFPGICMGFVGLFSLISYPAVVLHTRAIGLRNSLIWLSPVLLIMVIYIMWHLATGTPIDYRYLTFEALWENRFTVPVILRVLMLLFFASYLIIVLRNIWQLIPVYEKYSEDNYSDSSHNVMWLRLVIAAIGSICVAYFILIIWKNPIGQLIYTVVTVIFFILLSVNTFSRKLFSDNNDKIDVYWSFKEGWQLKEKCHRVSIEGDDAELMSKFEEWIKKSKPFINPDFTASDVYSALPQMRPPVMRDLLALRGLTFQSYVREWRINEACYIMEKEPDLLCKMIAFKVGFSSSQALSRAFIVVTGKTPMEYRRMLEENNRAN